MTRRTTKRRPVKRAAAPMTRLPWEDHHREIFRLASEDWTPPADIAVRHGVRSWTLTAIFTMPEGSRATLTTRLVRTATGAVRADEGMKFAFTVRGRK
ncbi:hypothetical protein ACFPIF_09925 [Brevundimonas faecalis]|uniref:hypothetical protein n=1 Tax=Brevundimonas faecalis TaxID=947378 RepID=UPI0036087DFE